jgi:drug/metabolite transporter (DMT)-like permease
MIDRNFIGNSAGFSAAVVATRVAVGTIPPLSLAFLRFGQGGLILLIFLFTLKQGLSQALTKIDLQAASLILFLGIFGGAVGYFLWTFALAHLTPTQVAVLIGVLLVNWPTKIVAEPLPDASS